MTTIIDINTIKDSYNKNLISRALTYINRTGVPYFVHELDLSRVNIPRFQRRANHGRIQKIIKDFDPNLVEIPVVCYNPETEKYDVIDGQHTILVLIALGYSTYPCKIYISLSNEEKIKIFTTQYKKKIRLSGVEVFNAYCAGGVEPAITIHKIFEEYGLSLGGPRETAKNVTSIRKIQQIFGKYGADGLRYTFDVIRDAGWTDVKAYTEAVLNIGFYSYEKVRENPANYDVLISSLTMYETSVEFIDYIRVNNLEVSAKHPEYGVRKVIEGFFN